MSEPDKRPEMVGWYDPAQLKNTALKTLISTIIGENADPRLVGAAAAGGSFFDYSRGLLKNDDDFSNAEKPREEIWIDYVSDVGDGWNSTYSVAFTLARERLEIEGKVLPRGEILVFGGDGVYPTANPDDYERRLVAPYQTAFETSLNGSKIDAQHSAAQSSPETAADLKTAPHVFALPGNHDWYDSLVAFQKLFCTHMFNARRFAGGWRTRQKRSYFALRLPHDWWLLGVDLQLSHNIDVPQLQYFESVIEKMNEGDRVILCVPEPYWVKAIKYEGITDVFEKKEESIEKLERILAAKKIRIKLYLAGDLHHYRRFESEDGRRTQKITAGGGGAFLHPTHDYRFDRNYAGKSRRAESFTLKKNYPDFETSRRLDWRNLYGFPGNNKTFGFLTAVLYPLLALLLRGEVSGDFSWTKAFSATVNRLVNEPIALLIVILMLMGLVFFTDSNSKLYRRIAGTIHGLAHLAAIFVLGWLGYLLSLRVIGEFQMTDPTALNLVWFASVVAICALGGYFFGSLIMGLYLFVSLHIFHRHDNEAFSALKIEDYKNFLRLHIGADGRLTIYPIKIERVSREWDCVKNGDQRTVCRPKSELAPQLIEPIDPIF